MIFRHNNNNLFLASFIILILVSSCHNAAAFFLLRSLATSQQISNTCCYADSLLEQEAARALAREQGEKDTIARAQVEEEVLTQSTAPREPLEAATAEELQTAKKANKKFWKERQRLLLSLGTKNKKKTSTGGGGMGFGGSAGGAKKDTKKSKDSNSNDNDTEQLKQIAFNPKFDPDGYAAIIRTEGVVRKNNVVRKETTAKLRQFIDDELARAEEDIVAGKISEQARFARVLLKRNRWDMSLPLGQKEGGADIVMQALYEMLGDSSSGNPGTVGGIIESALSSDAQLHELASLISDPDSDRQILHPDMAHQGDTQLRTGPPFVTCFVAVQDVDDIAMGPTEFLPGTNTERHHEEFGDFDRRDGMLRKAPTKFALLNEGDCSLYDTSTLHAGSANRSTKRRRIFYCTFRSVSLGDDRTFDEPGSIRGDVLERRLSLAGIREVLHEWKNQKTEDSVS